jgi:hypothetical protein
MIIMISQSKIRRDEVMPIVHHGRVPGKRDASGIRGKFLASPKLGPTGVALLLNIAEAGAAVPLCTCIQLRNR